MSQEPASLVDAVDGAEEEVSGMKKEKRKKAGKPLKRDIMELEERVEDFRRQLKRCVPILRDETRAYEQEAIQLLARMGFVVPDVSSKGFLSRYLATESGLFDIDIPMITPGHTPTKASFDIDAGQVAGRLSSLTLVTPSNLSRKRILSLDGSGTWAFAELFFLREILRQLCSELSEEEKQKYKLGRHPDDLQPHKFFDLIIGSSTGGLLALMFGSLKMSVDQAIAAFRYLCEKAFAPDVVKASAVFSSRFEASFKELISKAGVSKDRLFCPVHGGCRVAVTAAYESSITDLKVFRSHEIWDEVKLWEVARATIAMPRLFLPITIDDTEYVDASGTGHLNPIMAAVNEAHSIWRDDDFKYGCVISLGGGERPPVQRNPNLSADALLEAVVDAGQHGSREATQADNYFCDSDFYFRFEAKRPAYTHAVEDFDPEKLREAAGLAKAELNKPRRRKEIERAGQRLWTLSKQNGVEL
ncbi:FabD/lysophospholipase-like protein [Atractiella rhizophila]|nr:FabD/lysophospholipase-like protein [Atractiella rhizophila]